MDKSVSTSTGNRNTASAGKTKDFNSMASGIKNAVDEFKSNDKGKALASAAAALKPMRGFGMKAWRFTSDYARRHPVRTAITAISVGMFVAKLLRSKDVEAMAD